MKSIFCVDLKHFNAENNDFNRRPLPLKRKETADSSVSAALKRPRLPQVISEVHEVVPIQKKRNSPGNAAFSVCESTGLQMFD